MQCTFPFLLHTNLLPLGWKLCQRGMSVSDIMILFIYHLIFTYFFFSPFLLIFVYNKHM